MSSCVTVTPSARVDFNSRFITTSSKNVNIPFHKIEIKYVFILLYVFFSIKGVGTKYKIGHVSRLLLFNEREL